METQTIIIIILLAIIILSFLGINVFLVFGNLFQGITAIVNPIIIKALATMGYTTGTVLNSASDTVTNVGKTSLDIANGVVHDVNNLLIDSSKGQSIDNAINNQSTRSLNNGNSDVKPSSSQNPIQNPISSKKSGYCLVGEFQQKRGCVEVGENDLCLSGQIYSSRELCMNPTFTSNMQPLPQTMLPYNSVSKPSLPPNAEEVRPPIPPGQPNELMPRSS
jgi:hypothetical protein